MHRCVLACSYRSESHARELCIGSAHFVNLSLFGWATAAAGVKLPVLACDLTSLDFGIFLGLELPKCMSGITGNLTSRKRATNGSSKLRSSSSEAAGKRLAHASAPGRSPIRALARAFPEPPVAKNRARSREGECPLDACRSLWSSRNLSGPRPKAPKLGASSRKPTGAETARRVSLCGGRFMVSHLLKTDSGR